MVDSVNLKHIKQILAKIESEHNVTVLYAVESGSRAWGFHSPDSDYDIRFVYVHNDLNWYLQINKKPTETINGFSEDRVYDWDGWDIRKTVQHLKESNPAILEWLSSPIVYQDIHGFADDLRNIVSQMHTNLSLSHHYRSMAESNWNARIEGKDIVNTKKYMYIIRPIGMLDWLMRFPGKTLTIDYYKILDDLYVHMDNDVSKKINELLDYKKEAKEMGENPRIPEIDAYIKQVMERFDKLTDKKPVEINVQNLNRIYSQIENHYKKVIMVGAKNGYINRSEYLIIIGQTLKFVWLLQHPDKNKLHIPEKISELLRQVELPDDIREIMIEIISKDKLTELCQLTDAKSENVRKVVGLDFDEDDDDKYQDWVGYTPQGWVEVFWNVFLQYQNATGLKAPFDLLPMDSKKLPREDLIEIWTKKHIPELIWLLENMEQSIGRIPNQVHTKIKSATPENIQHLNKIIDENRTKYYLFYPKLNDWINKLLIDNKEKVEEVKQRNQQIKEELVHKNYQNSIKKLDPEIFNKVFVKYVRS